MDIDCYAAQEAKAPLEKFSYTSRNLNSWDVEVKISHCGICHSDALLIDNDWAFPNILWYPGMRPSGPYRPWAPRSNP